MEPLSFLIKNNFFWSYSDDEHYNNYHKNDALIIYSINNNERKEVKNLKKTIVKKHQKFLYSSNK